MDINFPRVTCTHGAEHDVFLFFEDLFKLEAFDVLVAFHNCLRDCFGGSRHASATMLKKCRKNHDDEIILSFIKIAETLMGGKITDLLRLISLRDPITTKTHSNGFCKLNV